MLLPPTQKCSAAPPQTGPKIRAFTQFIQKKILFISSPNEKKKTVKNDRFLKFRLNYNNTRAFFISAEHFGNFQKLRIVSDWATVKRR